MRGPNSRKKIDTLFVLGAGASYGASMAKSTATVAPLDKDFCKRIQTLDCSKPYWVSASRDILGKQWKDFHEFKEMGLEAAILKQLGHLEFLSSIQPKRMKGTIEQAEYLNHLAHIICFILRKVKPSRNDPYASLFEKAFKVDEFSKVKNRVITFNYDDLLDRHFVEQFGVRQTYFDKLKERKDASGRRSKDDKVENPLLLKLHGSVNWLCETSEFERVITGNETEEKPYKIPSIWYSKKKVPKPDDTESPLIIPPLPVKPITSIEIFRWLWTRAYEYLHEARELVVCGYSLPDTDRMALSLFSNFKNNHLERVTVVDKDPTILSKWRELLRRNGINKDARWSYCETFEEYTEQLELK